MSPDVPPPTPALPPLEDPLAPDSERPGEHLDPGAAPPLRSLPAPPPERAARQRARPRGARDVARVRQSLALSMVEGGFAEIFASSAGGTALTAWAIALGFGPVGIALLGATPYIGQIAQIPAAMLVSRRSPRRVAIGFVLASRLALLPLALLAYLRPLRETAQGVLGGLAVLSALLAVVGNNGWQAWMADLVPGALRGRYFGRRIAATTLVSALGTLAVSVLIDRARAKGVLLAQLGELSLVAGGAALVAAVLMREQFEPRHDPSPPASTLEAVLAPVRDPAGRRFLAYTGAWSLASGLTTGLFSIYLLRSIGLGFVGIALHGLALASCRTLAAPLWGRLMDRAGAGTILFTATALLVAMPLVWTAARPGFYAPIAFDAVVSGILLSGQAVASFTIPLGLGLRRDRPYYVGVFALGSGMAFAAAALAGGLVARRSPETFHADPFRALFGLAAAVRAVAAIAAWRCTPRPLRVRPL